MKRLGYTHYVAQGGDWGAKVSEALARQAPEGLLGIHINLLLNIPPEIARSIDIDFAQRTMNVTRSIVYGFVGPCKTESSQKPVPVHPLLGESLLEWRKHCVATKPGIFVLLEIS